MTPQVKVLASPTFLELAAEQFLGRTEEEIASTLLRTLEGHLRAILSSLTVDEVNGDRRKLAGLVAEVAGPDLARMGMVVLSFTIRELGDQVEHLESLGKAQIAAVR